MELMYPVIVIISIIIVIAIYLIELKRKSKYTNGKKVANTKYIKDTDYYKSKIKKYKIYSILLKTLSIVSIIITSILIARPVTMITKSEDKYNRDIILTLDISTSQCEVNLELVKKFKEILPKIEGDRIGIVLFNTAPIVYCPLTDDYDYINECFNTIEKQMKLISDNNGYIPMLEDEKEEDEATAFWDGGVLCDNSERGSSLVGDGLARSSFCISKYKNR